MIRWLVVGTGGAGKCHIAAIERSSQATVAGLVTLDEPGGNEYPVFASLDDALRGTDVDAVVVATPTHTHRKMAGAAIEAGLPVLCEKPVGLNSAEAEQLQQLSTRRGVAIGAVLNQRACLHNRWLRQQIDDAILRPRAVTVIGAISPLRGWASDPARSGGGLLRTVGIHYLDLLVWWLGLPVQVAAMRSGEPVEDSISVIATFRDGCQASIHLASVCETGRGPVETWIESDSARVGFRGHEIVHTSGCDAPPPVEPGDPVLAYGPGHLRIIDEATNALLEQREFPVPLSSALPTLQLVDRIYAIS